MAIYQVRVTEDVTVHYPMVEIEASSEDEARDIAEEMRVQGQLGDPHSNETVDDVIIDVNIKEV